MVIVSISFHLQKAEQLQGACARVNERKKINSSSNNQRGLKQKVILTIIQIRFN